MHRALPYTLLEGSDDRLRRAERAAKEAGPKDVDANARWYAELIRAKQISRHMRPFLKDVVAFGRAATDVFQAALSELGQAGDTAAEQRLANRLHGMVWARSGAQLALLIRRLILKGPQTDARAIQFTYSRLSSLAAILGKARLVLVDIPDIMLQDLGFPPNHLVLLDDEGHRLAKLAAQHSVYFKQAAPAR